MWYRNQEITKYNHAERGQPRPAHLSSPDRLICLGKSQAKVVCVWWGEGGRRLKTKYKKENTSTARDVPLKHQYPFLCHHGMQSTANRLSHFIASYNMQESAEDLFYSFQQATFLIEITVLGTLVLNYSSDFQKRADWPDSTIYHITWNTNDTIALHSSIPSCPPLVSVLHKMSDPFTYTPPGKQIKN